MFLVPTPEAKSGVRHEEDNHGKEDNDGPTSSKTQGEDERDKPQDPFRDPDGYTERAQSSRDLRGGFSLCWRGITLVHSPTKP